MRLALAVLCLFLVACSSPSSRSRRSASSSSPVEVEAPPSPPSASVPTAEASAAPPAPTPPAAFSATLPTHSSPCTRMFFVRAGTLWEGSAWWPSEAACEGRNQFTNQPMGERPTVPELWACYNQAHAWAIAQAREQNPSAPLPSRARSLRGLQCEVRHRSSIGGDGD